MNTNTNNNTNTNTNNTTNASDYLTERELARAKRAAKIKANRASVKRAATMLDATCRVRDLNRGVYRSRMMQS